MADCLKTIWVCLACSWKGEIGGMVCRLSQSPSLFCPRCNSANVSPADGETRSTEIWLGDKPAMSN